MKLYIHFIFFFLFMYSASAEKNFSILDQMHSFCLYKTIKNLLKPHLIADTYATQLKSETGIKGRCNYYLEKENSDPMLIPNTFIEISANEYCNVSNIKIIECNKKISSIPDDYKFETVILDEETSDKEETILTNEENVDIIISESESGMNVEQVIISSDLTRKIKELKSLLDQGLISQVDYDKKKNELLDEF